MSTIVLLGDYHVGCDEVSVEFRFISGQYVDLDYSIWLYRLLTPLMLTFVLPTLFVLLIYLSISFLYVYKLHRLVESLFLYVIRICFYISSCISVDSSYKYTTMEILIFGTWRALWSQLYGTPMDGFSTVSRIAKSSEDSIRE